MDRIIEARRIKEGRYLQESSKNITVIPGLENVITNDKESIAIETNAWQQKSLIAVSPIYNNNQTDFEQIRIFEISGISLMPLVSLNYGLAYLRKTARVQGQLYQLISKNPETDKQIEQIFNIMDLLKKEPKLAKYFDVYSSLMDNYSDRYVKILYKNIRMELEERVKNSRKLVFQMEEMVKAATVK